MFDGSWIELVLLNQVTCKRTQISCVHRTWSCSSHASHVGRKLNLIWYSCAVKIVWHTMLLSAVCGFICLQYSMVEFGDYSSRITAWLEDSCSLTLWSLGCFACRHQIMYCVAFWLLLMWTSCLFLSYHFVYFLIVVLHGNFIITVNWSLEYTFCHFAQCYSIIIETLIEV